MKREGVIDREAAEEYTAALGQVFGGGYRLVHNAQRLGVPAALGMTLEAWVEERLGGYIRMSIPERREAVAELKAEGLSQREIGAVLGVAASTVNADLQPSVQNRTQREEDEGRESAPSVRIRTSTEEVDPAPPFAVVDLETGEVVGGTGVAEPPLAGQDVIAAADPEDELRHDRLRKQLYGHLSTMSRVVALRPESIAEMADAELKEDLERGFRNLRCWMDRVERALPRGLRVVG